MFITFPKNSSINLAGNEMRCKFTLQITTTMSSNTQKAASILTATEPDVRARTVIMSHLSDFDIDADVMHIRIVKVLVALFPDTTVWIDSTMIQEAVNLFYRRA